MRPSSRQFSQIFSFFFSFLSLFPRLKRHFFVPVLTFADISPRMNIRWIYFWICKIIHKKSNVLSRPSSREGESIFFEEAYDFSLFPITTVSRLGHSDSPPPPSPSLLPRRLSYPVIIAKSAETQKRNTLPREEYELCV